MIAQRGFLVSTLMLISFTGIGFCQTEGDSNDLPHESSFTPLPDLPDDLPEDWPGPGITDQKPKTSLTFDISTFPPFTSKAEATSEPQVVATTQPVEPEPSRKPEPEIVDFRYPDDSSGPVCVRACLAAYFEVTYEATREDGETEDRTAIIPLPSNAQIGGKCGSGKKDDLTRLILQWGNDNYILKITFRKTRSGDTDNWEVTPIQFSYDTRDITYFPDATDPGLRTVLSDPKEEFFESPWKKSFVCKSENIITMTSPDKSSQSIFRIEELQLQPFMKEQANGTFSESETCESDKDIKPTSNVASVAVGATLGCLILIVIIVYAVGRKMGSITDRTGYKAVD